MEERQPDHGGSRRADAEGGMPAGKPTDLPKSSWKAALKRTVREFKEDSLTDWAAALTYYGILAIFPALLALVSILGLLGRDSIQSLIDNRGSIAPGAAKDVLTSALEQLEDNRGSAIGVLIVGIVIALWSASGYIAAFMRASNVKRPFRWVTPGGVLAVVIWIIASALFALYVADLGSYNKTYGGLAAVIVFLVRLWISDIAILLGLEYYAELERSRAIEAGHPPGEEPYAEPRDTRKL